MSSPQKWLNGAKLRLNVNRTDLMIFAQNNLVICYLELSTDYKLPEGYVENWCFILDDRLFLSKQDSPICLKGCYFLHTNMLLFLAYLVHTIRQSNTKDLLVELARVLIPTKLDNYDCNSFIMGYPIF